MNAATTFADTRVRGAGLMFDFEVDNRALFSNRVQAHHRSY